MNPKQAKLERVKAIWELYERSQLETDDLRQHLAEAVKDARSVNATQQQIANQTRLSRQRIQQMLVKE